MNGIIDLLEFNHSNSANHEEQHKVHKRIANDHVANNPGICIFHYHMKVLELTSFDVDEFRIPFKTCSVPEKLR
jgi:hypothetical protein